VISSRLPPRTDGIFDLTQDEMPPPDEELFSVGLLSWLLGAEVWKERRIERSEMRALGWSGADVAVAAAAAAASVREPSW
jgi:hypothetical protein